MNKQDSIRTIKSELEYVPTRDIELIISLLNKLAQIEYDNYMKSSQ
ncbi:MAG: hypothetical protein HKP14_00910 [Bacteroidia bacterium]|nr:hypothetical protein [Bacteroidia bacterium]